MTGGLRIISFLDFCIFLLDSSRGKKEGNKPFVAALPPHLTAPLTAYTENNLVTNFKLILRITTLHSQGNKYLTHVSGR